jgi:hypothetical protein
VASLGEGRFQFLADRGSIGLPQLQNVAQGSVPGAALFEVRGPEGELDVPKLASVRGTSFATRAGGELTLPGLTSFTHDTVDFNNPATMVSEGSQSQLQFPALTSLVSNSTRGSGVSVQATLGGHVDFDALKTFGGGIIDVVASGAGSMIDMDALTTIPKGQTRFESKQASSHVGLAQLASAANTGFEAFEGAEISLPKLTQYNHALDAGVFNQPVLWTADGVGSRVSAPALAAMTSNAVRGSEIKMRVGNGGVIDLSAVANITDGTFSLLAEGAGSKVDLSALVSVTHPAATAQDVLPITVQNGALLEFNAAKTTLLQAQILLTNGGRIEAGTLELTGKSSLAADGTIAATLSNEGITRIAGGIPGGDNVGLLEVTGAFTQTDKGEMVVQIGGDTPGASHDALHVGQAANVAGKMTIQLVREYQPVLGQTFDVLTANSVAGSMTGGLLAGDVFLAPTSQANKVVVMAALVGDADLDGKVNLTDFGLLKAGFGKAGGGLTGGDVNASGNTDLTDFGLLKENFGKSGGPKAGALGAAPVPEPSTISLALLALALLAYGRRRPAKSGSGAG